MGDMGEMWNEVKKDKRDRNAKSFTKSCDLISKLEIPFDKKGLQYVFTTPTGVVIDIWIQTGTWIQRKKGKPRGGRRGKGLHSLLKQYFPEELKRIKALK